jgi:hypothetical protein
MAKGERRYDSETESCRGGELATTWMSQSVAHSLSTRSSGERARALVPCTHLGAKEIKVLGENRNRADQLADELVVKLSMMR